VAHTRITAGEWRGRVIDTPRGSTTRPTRSLIREALFNIVGAAIDGAWLIDLYAGAGTVGFEALSRGAAKVTFVDRDRTAIRSIAATADRFGCSDRCAVVAAYVPGWARQSSAKLAAADMCFIDAPYRDPDLERVLEAVGASPPGLVVCEHHRERRLPERIGKLELTRQVRHGLTSLSFLQPTST
jgi:16S rRNA (guanine966-N2)-methyltransferase